MLMSVSGINLSFNKNKYMQEKKKEEMPDVKRQGWSIKELDEQSVNKPSDEMTREVLRGDETDEEVNAQLEEMS